MHRTTLILQLLVDVDYATTDDLASRIACPRSELVKSLSKMRKREVLTSVGGKHTITVKGRSELSQGLPPKSVTHQPFQVPNARQQSAYLLAKPSGMTVHPEQSVMRRPKWTPEPWTPARPGADDHKVYGSKGIR